MEACLMPLNNHFATTFSPHFRQYFSQHVPHQIVPAKSLFGRGTVYL